MVIAATSVSSLRSRFTARGISSAIAPLPRWYSWHGSLVAVVWASERLPVPGDVAHPGRRRAVLAVDAFGFRRRSSGLGNAENFIAW